MKKLTESDSDIQLDELDLSYQEIKNFLVINEELLQEITQMSKERLGDVKILDFSKRKNTAFKLKVYHFDPI